MIGAIGAIVSGIGSLVSASGASKNAKAMQKAFKNAGKEEDALFKRQSNKLDTLISDKESKLYDLGNIFDRFESTGAFGDTDTLKNLRKAQSDFSALAAGDFTAFEAQLRKSMSDSLIATAGSGAPIGTFAGLAADQQMQFRQQGVSTGIGITEFLSNEANKLLGTEFGVMDQEFNTQYELDRTRVTNKNQFLTGAAAQTGVGRTAYGNAITQGGSLLNAYGMYQTQLGIQNRGFDLAQKQIDLMGSQSVAPAAGSARSVVPSYGFVEPMIPSFNDASLSNFQDPYAFASPFGDSPDGLTDYQRYFTPAASRLSAAGASITGVLPPL